MTTLERSVLVTICYYDALEYPLTAWEVWRFLVNPFFVPQTRSAGMEEGSYYAVREALRGDALDGYVTRCNGMTALKGRDALFLRRDRRQTRSLRGWRRARRAAWWLQGVPFLRLVAASGSLALSNTRKESDLDFFIVTAPRRIWMVRFFVTVLTHMMGIRRHGRRVANRVCLNHFVTSDAQCIPHQTMYTAHLYAHLVPLVDRLNIPTALADFWRVNQWMEQFLAFPPAVRNSDGRDSGLYHRRRVRRASFLLGWARLWEFFLRGWIGDAVERLVKNVQLRWMGRAHRTLTAPKAEKGRVVVSDTELAFHPGSPEIGILARFEKNMVHCGLFHGKDGG